MFPIGIELPHLQASLNMVMFTSDYHVWQWIHLLVCVLHHYCGQIVAVNTKTNTGSSKQTSAYESTNNKRHEIRVNMVSVVWKNGRNLQGCSNSWIANMGLPSEYEMCHSSYEETPKHCLWDCTNVEVVWELIINVCRQLRVWECSPHGWKLT